MLLFVKRTFAIKVSSTSRIDQSNEAGEGRWKRMGPSKDPRAAGPVGFSVTALEMPIRDCPDPPHCDPGMTELSELRTTSKLIQAARPVSISISTSQGWERWSEGVNCVPCYSLPCEPLLWQV